MNFYNFFRRYYFSGERSGLQRLLRLGLAPLVPVYSSARFLHQAYRKSRSVRLEAPVLSVGNLSLGGTGKTAFTLWVLNQAKQLGVRPAVLKRGEGGEEGVLPGSSPPHELAGRYGDETALYRWSFPEVPVGVGSDRVERGREILRRTEANLLILDDGFQYTRLERDLDVVLVTPEDVLDDWQLPAGPLREPLAALERADCISLKVTDGADWRPPVRKLDQFRSTGTPVISHEYEFNGIFEGGEDRTERYRREGGILVSTLARPDELESFLEARDIPVLEHHSLPDHAELTRENLPVDFDRDRILMTEKEAVKLPPDRRERVGIIRSRLRVNSPGELLQSLRTLLSGTNEDPEP